MRLPGEEYEGQAQRLRQTARSPHSTLCVAKRRHGQDDSVVMTLILSVCHGDATKDAKIR